MSGIVGGAGSKSGVIGETEIDYESGVFSAELRGASARASTPVIADNTSGKLANYVRVGDLVHIDIYFGAVNTNGASGQLQIYNLPFNSNGRPSTISVGFLVNMLYTEDYIPILTVDGTKISGNLHKYQGSYASWSITSTATAYIRCAGTYSIG